MEILFDFKNNLKTIHSLLFYSEHKVVVNNDCFVLYDELKALDSLLVIRDNYCYELTKKSYQVYANAILAKQGIFIAKVSQYGKNFLEEYDHAYFYKKILIEQQMLCIKNYLDEVFLHLDKRVSEREKLTNHAHIKMLIANIVIDIESMQVEKIAKFMQIAPEIINQACQRLAKLLGGRAFLASHIIEMQWTFNLLNSIYFV